MPVTKDYLKKLKNEDITDIKPISRKYYPVDYRDIHQPVWYNTPFDTMDYAVACIEVQLPKEVHRHFKIHRGRYIKEKRILRATTPFKDAILLKKYIFNEEHKASFRIGKNFTKRISLRNLKKKRGYGVVRTPDHPKYKYFIARKERAMAERKAKKLRNKKT